MYCIMCGASGHGIRECAESKFFIGQDICRMDVNNQVVMSDGMALPHAKGEGGVAKQIHSCMAGNIPVATGPTSTSASNVEVVAEEANYMNKLEELTILGSMEFEVLPADRSDKTKKAKPYDCPEAKKSMEKTVPVVIPWLQPNKVYVELPPMILKHPTPETVLRLQREDQEMVDESVPTMTKGKQWE